MQMSKKIYSKIFKNTPKIQYKHEYDSEQYNVFNISTIVHVAVAFIFYYKTLKSGTRYQNAHLEKNYQTIFIHKF